MIKSRLVMLSGFGIGLLGGFIYGQAARKNAASNVSAGFSGGVVTISADLGNIAKASADDIKTKAAERLRSFLRR